MKETLILLTFLLISLISYSQWEVKNDTNSILNKYKTDLFYIDSSGTGFFCGLYSDDSDYSYTYYKRTDKDDLIYFKELSLKDSSYVLGFLRLNSKKVYNNVYECW